MHRRNFKEQIDEQSMADKGKLQKSKWHRLFDLILLREIREDPGEAREPIFW